MHQDRFNLIISIMRDRNGFRLDLLRNACQKGIARDPPRLFEGHAILACMRLNIHRPDCRSNTPLLRDSANEFSIRV